MIFIDATETRDNTRLPDGVIRAGQVVTGLEAMTGADLLLSTLTTPKLPAKLDPESKPHRTALRKHLAEGMLIQRKSGRDLTGSIPELSSILQRMRSTRCPLCWLLVCADLGCNRDGECLIDGQPSGYSYAAVMGALDYWQVRGGYVSILHRDALVPKWIDSWLVRLRDIQAEPVKQVVQGRAPMQVLTAPDWTMNVLCGLPGIGPDKAQAIKEKCNTLADAFWFLTDTDNDFHIDGLGPKTIESMRKVFGVPEGMRLGLVPMENGESE